jgi:hypothetical protein
MHITFRKEPYLQVEKPKNPAGFEPRIFSSLGGRDDHFATPPGLNFVLLFIVNCLLWEYITEFI